MEHSFETDKHTPNEQDKRDMRRLGLDPANEEHVEGYARNLRILAHKEERDRHIRLRMVERYTYGWQNIAAALDTEPVVLEEPAFRIRWWHRVIYRLWKWARKYV